VILYFLNCENIVLKRSSKIIFSFFRTASLEDIGLIVHRYYLCGDQPSMTSHEIRRMLNHIFFPLCAGTALSVGLFSHVLKIDDAIIGIMSCMSKILAGFVYAFATTDWMVYLGKQQKSARKWLKKSFSPLAGS